MDDFGTIKFASMLWEEYWKIGIHSGREVNARLESNLTLPPVFSS